MTMSSEDRKRWLDFLTNRWLALTNLAVIERVYFGVAKHAQENNEQIPSPPIVIAARPCTQIAMIKQQIIKVLPEAKFIDYDFETQAPLNPDDYADIYVQEQVQCVDKVCELMERLQIT